MSDEQARDQKNYDDLVRKILTKPVDPEYIPPPKPTSYEAMEKLGEGLATEWEIETPVRNKWAIAFWKSVGEK